MSNFSDHLQTAIRMPITLQNGLVLDTVLCSVYFRGDSNELISENLKNLVEYCQHESIELIIGCDSNSHNPVWGDKKLDHRGIKMLEFIQDNNLSLLNKGTIPTYFIEQTNGTKESCIDLSLATTNMNKFINNWRVSLRDSCSDHRHIFFGFSMEKIKSTFYVRKKATDYQKYRKILTAKLRNYNPVVDSIEDLDTSAEILTNIILESFKQCMVLKKNEYLVRQPWLTQDHMNKRKSLNAQYQRARKSNNVKLKEKYRKDMSEFMKTLRKARNNSWRKFTTEIESTKEAARLQKFFEGYTARRTITIEKSDGTFTSNADETNAELLKAKFPECTVLDINDDWPENIFIHDPLDCSELAEINECTSKDRILWAIHDFESYKTAGDDEIFPALLQKGSDLLVSFLQTLFRASLKLSYVPKTWRNTLVTFIPKPGKENYGLTDSQRAICLMSFILKTLEKLLDKRIRQTDLANCPLDNSQHAYQSGKGTESALHDLVHHIDLALDNKLITYTVFIDISGAFDNTTVDTMIEHCGNMGISKWIINWVEMMLKN